MMAEYDILHGYILKMLVSVYLHGKLHRSYMVVKHIHLSQIDTDHQSIRMGKYTESHWLDPVK